MNENLKDGNVVVATHQHEGQPEVLWLLTPKGDHLVVYGESIVCFGSYADPYEEQLNAAREFGECVLHSSGCAGLVPEIE